MTHTAFEQSERDFLLAFFPQMQCIHDLRIKVKHEVKGTRNDMASTKFAADFQIKIEFWSMMQNRRTKNKLLMDDQILLDGQYNASSDAY